MERRDTGDFQWPYMASPTLQNLQLSSSNHRRIPINGSQVFYQNHALQNYGVLQNPASQVSGNPNLNQNHALQNPAFRVSGNPNLNQNHALQHYDVLQHSACQVSGNPNLNQNHADVLQHPASQVSGNYNLNQNHADVLQHPASQVSGNYNLNQNHDAFQNPASQVSCNPNFYQNHVLQNYNPFQNPSSCQGYPMTQTCKVSRPARPFYEGLEDSFSRMNLNVFSTDHNHSSLIRSSLPLQRMRVESAVRGKMGLYQEVFGRHANSTRSIGSQNMVGGAMTRSANFPSTPVANDFDFSLQRRGPSFEGLDYASSRRLINNSDLHCCYGNTLAVNGLGSGNFSSNSLSSMYNHQHSKYSCLEVFSDREEIEMMFLKVKDRLHDLMVHKFHNYIIQKLLEAGSREQRTELLLLLVSNKQKFLVVCTDEHGTGGVLKFMELISSQEEGAILLSALEPIAFTLTTDIHGRHIIERCLNKFSNEDTKHIVHEIADHCFKAATNQSGCRVLQQCLAQANAEARNSMFSKIIENAVILSEDAFGNYVVQYVLGMRIPHVTLEIMVQFEGSFVNLSMNKHGSHVVEKCLTDAGEEHSAMIITEIMQNKKDFLTIAQNAYGNYVVLRALDVSKGDLHRALVILIRSFLPSLESHRYGKNVVRQIKGGKKRV